VKLELRPPWSYQVRNIRASGMSGSTCIELLLKSESERPAGQRHAGQNAVLWLVDSMPAALWRRSVCRSAYRQSRTPWLT